MSTRSPSAHYSSDRCVIIIITTPTYIDSGVNIGESNTNESQAVADSSAATDEVDVVGEGLHLTVGVGQRIERFDAKSADEKVVGTRCTIRDEEHRRLASVDTEGVEVDGREDRAQRRDRTSGKRKRKNES